MADQVRDPKGTKVYECGIAGAQLHEERDALDLVGAGISAGATWVAIPVARLDPRFFRLRSGLAGAMLQKLVQYQRRVAIVGDISEYVAASTALAGPRV